jgi:Tol biopolymer transport system component
MRLSCSEIVRRDVRLGVSEAVALALAAARELDELSEHHGRGLPPPEQILLSSDGRVCFSGPGDEADDGERVRQVATLLQGFLPLEHGSTSAADTRVPGALLVLLARATGRLDAPLSSYARFQQELSRFCPNDAAPLKSLYWRCVGRGRDVALGTTAPATVLAWRAQTEVAELRRGNRRRPHVRAAEFQRDFRQTRRRRLVNRVAMAAGAVACAAGGGLGGWFLALTLFDASSPDTHPAISAALTREVREPEATSVGVSGRVREPLAIEPEPSGPDSGSRDRALDRSTAVRFTQSAFPVNVVTVAPLVSAAAAGNDAFSPSFARQGRSLLFHAGRDRAALMRASIGDDGDVRVATLLRDGAANYHAALSPDGESLAYDSDRDGTRGVYIARADASDPRRISGDGYAAVPSWSPDSRRLTFVKAELRRPSIWNVWIADLESGTLSQVSRHRVGQSWRAPWFPDGERIAYSVEDELVIASVRTGTSRAFRSPVPGRLVRTPAVSPDGRSIVFQVYRDGAWLLDVPTGKMRRLLADPSAEEFAWSPDGLQVAYHTRRGRSWSVWQVSLGEPR